VHPTGTPTLRPITQGVKHLDASAGVPAEPEESSNILYPYSTGPLPFEGTLEQLADTMNHELGAWADDWS
jgi:hypothetical protein